MQPDVLTLPDGRHLAYAEYGKLDGPPVIFCHGTPGSHLLPAKEIALLERVGLRFIVPVRPGYGRSDFQPERTLLDWPDDVLELATVLGIERFGVMGVSGGGPFALACAHKIPERLTNVVLAGGLAPFELLGEKPQPMTHERREFKAKLLESDPDEYLAPMLANIGEPDLTQLLKTKDWFIANIREAYWQGVDGAFYEDTLLLTQPWGFTLEAITAPVQIWQGEMDGVVPPKHAHCLAAHLPNAVVSFRRGVGHLMPEAELEAIYRQFVDED